jgi:hypothetical protein
MTISFWLYQSWWAYSMLIWYFGIDRAINDLQSIFSPYAVNIRRDPFCHDKFNYASLRLLALLFAAIKQLAIALLVLAAILGLFSVPFWLCLAQVWERDLSLRMNVLLLAEAIVAFFAWWRMCRGLARERRQ